MKAADISQKHVLAFRRTVSKSQPVVVPVRPKFGKELNDCTNIVKEHVLMHGGVQHLGKNQYTVHFSELFRFA